jgi:hypothetical protein
MSTCTTCAGTGFTKCNECSGIGYRMLSSSSTATSTVPKFSKQDAYSTRLRYQPVTVTVTPQQLAVTCPTCVGYLKVRCLQCGGKCFLCN